MPSHGVDIIDGIPVILKDGSMYAFQPELKQATAICLGKYSAATKSATWELKDDAKAWLATYKEGLAPRSRKV
jgi:hypothetical protein